MEGGVDGMAIAVGLFPANYVQSLHLPADAAADGAGDAVGGIGSMTAPIVSCFVSCLDPKRDRGPAPIDK